VAATTCSGDLAADGPSLQSFLVKLVDARRSDTGSGFFLVDPALVKQFTETIEISSQ
jgi:hypothetical protein